jgi:hypothetical protein
LVSNFDFNHLTPSEQKLWTSYQNEENYKFLTEEKENIPEFLFNRITPEKPLPKLVPHLQQQQQQQQQQHQQQPHITPTKPSMSRPMAIATTSDQPSVSNATLRHDLRPRNLVVYKAHHLDKQVKKAGELVRQQGKKTGEQVKKKCCSLQ